jgi:hypothetical protein
VLIGSPLAHADPGTGCSIKSAGQLVATLAAHDYTVEVISAQVARDLNVDTADGLYRLPNRLNGTEPWTISNGYARTAYSELPKRL